MGNPVNATLQAPIGASTLLTAPVPVCCMTRYRICSVQARTAGKLVFPGHSPMLKYRYDIHGSGRPRYPVPLTARMQCLKHDALCALEVLMLLLSSSRTHSALEWPARSCPQCLACTCACQRALLAVTFRPGWHDNSLCRHTAYWHSSGAMACAVKLICRVSTASLRV